MNRLLVLLMVVLAGSCGAACSAAVYRIQPAPTTTPVYDTPASDTNAAWLNEDGTLTCPLDHHQERGTCVPD